VTAPASPWCDAAGPTVAARRWRVAVIIPARDEAATIDSTLTAIRRSVVAAERSGRVTGSVVVVVVADRCTDGTAALARSHLSGSGAVVEVDHGSAGAARAAGTGYVLARLGGPLHTAWIANTDADTEVAEDWILRQLDHADAGIACVTGIIDLAAVHPSLRAAFAGGYMAEVGTDGHPHVHGANFGIRADALALAGNWTSASTGEDHDLWERIGRHGLPRRQDPRLVVTTSARLSGRAPDGFAADLLALSSRCRTTIVDHQHETGGPGSCTDAGIGAVAQG